MPYYFEWHCCRLWRGTRCFHRVSSQSDCWTARYAHRSNSGSPKSPIVHIQPETLSLYSRIADHPALRKNHLTWPLCQLRFVLRDKYKYELWTGAMQRVETVFFMRPDGWDKCSKGLGITALLFYEFYEKLYRSNNNHCISNMSIYLLFLLSYWIKKRLYIYN